MATQKQLALLWRHIKTDTTLDRTSNTYLALLSELLIIFIQPNDDPQALEDQIVTLFTRVGLAPSSEGVRLEQRRP